MPTPASEDDLKRRARRRLIGAVALTLVAVIALPLLLEDEPPPAERLEVRMPPVAELSSPDLASPPQAPIPAGLPKPAQAEIAPIAPTPPEPKADPTPPQPRTTPEVAVPAPEKPALKPKPVAPTQPKPKAPVNVPSKPESKPVTNEAPSAFVVQLGAFSDAEKAIALKDRAAELGLPAYTDKSGPLTRLRVGPFPSRQAAIEAAETLANSGVDGQVMPK